MSEYDNTNSGAIFANDKGDNDKRPDRKGSLNVEGTEYWISGWIRKDKAGKPYMSLKVERKDKNSNSSPGPAQSRPAPTVDNDDTDDIPF